MSSKKLQRWYQQVLSGFAQAKNDGTIYKHNLSIEEQEKVRKIVVPIFAEALNRNLQRFINMNYGTRNVDFFLYRTKIHFV